MFLLECISTKRRYLAYLSLLFCAYTETCSRFGVAISMMGGMVKHDCQDPGDAGEYCWTEDTQALVLGSYFYGYTAQFLTILLAKRVLGFTNAYRLWLITAGIVEICFPALASVSPIFVVVTQAIRGLLAGVMIAYNFDFIAKFAVADESKILIPLLGATFSTGQGTGSLIAGFMNERFGWKYYFYFIGSAYLVGLVLNLIFIHDSLEDYWYLTPTEKNLMTKPEQKEESTSLPTDKTLVQSLKYLFCRWYLLSFCVYVPAYNLIYYNLFGIVPFYLHSVLGADTLFVSYICVSLAILIALSTIAFSFLLRLLDRLLPWLQCRMLLTLVPMVFQIVFSIALTKCDTVYGGVFVLALSAVAASTLFSGSINTLNYEIDPDNSAVFISVYNSFGQMAGFLGPALMATITSTDPDTPNYQSVYRERWNFFFYTVAGCAAAGCVAVVLAYCLNPGEWINREKMRQKREQVYVEA
ncbi:hypothetical protein ACHWQZ_G015967 [Mnemiopsis leidyi]